MKKIFLVMLSVIMICSICFVLAGCSPDSKKNDSKKNVVGVWKNVTWKEGRFEKYLYVYEDGTCDSYGTLSKAENYPDIVEYNSEHYHAYKAEWSIEGEYFVIGSTGYIGSSIEKYKINGTNMYDSQGKLVYEKTSYDVRNDVVITK